MAALSPDLAPEEVLGGLARNIVTNGYQASASSDSLDQTEYLKLVFRYLSQARELDKLATEQQSCHQDRELRIIQDRRSASRPGLSHARWLWLRSGPGDGQCDTRIPDHRFRISARAIRAVSSDEPPFRLRFSAVPSTRVCTDKEYWLSALDKANGDFIDVFLSDPALCRLYLGLSKLDPETAEQTCGSRCPRPG